MFVRSELSSVYSKLDAALEKLECLGDPQVASHLLRCCLGASKVVHTAPYAECAEFSKRGRSLLKACWGTVIGNTLTEANWSLASLPVRLGGFGASDPAVLHPQAAVASFLSAASGRAGLPLTRLHPDLLAAVDALCLTVPQMAKPLREHWFLDGCLSCWLTVSLILGLSRSCGPGSCKVLLLAELIVTLLTG